MATKPKAFWISPATRWHRVTAFLLVVILLSAGAGKYALSRAGPLGPTPTSIELRLQSRRYIAEGIVYSEWTRAAQYGTGRSAPWRIVEADARYGYLLTDQGGPRGFARWLGKEELSIDVTTGRASPAECDAVAQIVLAELLADPRVAVAKPRVSPAHPRRIWYNKRGIADWTCDLLLAACPIFLALLIVLEFVRRSRAWALAQGVCPYCAYPMVEVTGHTCPECGTLVTNHERHILDHHLPPK